MIKDFEKPLITETNLKKLDFEDFLTKTFPLTIDRPDIRSTAVTLLKSLIPISNTGEKGIFAYIKKGAMRRFSLENGAMQDNLIACFERLTPSEIGDSAAVHKIVKDNFTGVMDLDIRLDRKNPKNRKEVIPNLVKSLIDKGFVIKEQGNQVVMEKDGLAIAIEAITIDEFSGRTKWAFDFFSTDGRKPVFRMDIIDLPQEIEEYKSDVTDTWSASDLDQFYGFIALTGDNLDFYYETVDDKPAMIDYLQGNYFNNISLVNRFTTGIHQNILRGSRQIAQRAMYWDPLFDSYPFFTLKELIQTSIQNEPNSNSRIFGNKTSVEKLTKPLSDYFRAAHDYLLSCQIGLSSGQIMGIPLFYLTDFAAFTPLGQIIKNRAELDKLMNLMLGKIYPLCSTDLPLSFLAIAYDTFVLAERDTSKLFGLLLVDSLKDMGKIPAETPRTLTTTATLLDPLELINPKSKFNY